MPRYNPTRRRFYVADKWISRARTADEMQIIREYHKELAIWETERAIAAVRGIENYAPEPQLGEAAIRLFEE